MTEILVRPGNLFRGSAKDVAIGKLAAINWSRTTVDSEGNVALNETWFQLGLLILKPNRQTSVVQGQATDTIRLLGEITRGKAVCVSLAPASSAISTLSL